jgi:quercetin dioxygenase-like cupin family protein
MDFSRRDLSFVLPALFAAQAAAQASDSLMLPSKCYEYSELPVKTSPETHIESRQVFRGVLHDGFEIACHITRLPAGLMPHAPHRHVNEEIFFLKEGTLDITVEGKTTRLETGSVAFIASNELHGSKNVGDTTAQYFILELDGAKKNG